MKCTGKEWDHCRVEKMGCDGCHYNSMTLDEAIDQVESLIDDRKSFIDPMDKDENNIFRKDIKAIKIVLNRLKQLEEYYQCEVNLLNNYVSKKDIQEIIRKLEVDIERNKRRKIEQTEEDTYSFINIMYSPETIKNVLETLL